MPSLYAWSPLLLFPFEWYAHGTTERAAANASELVSTSKQALAAGAAGNELSILSTAHVSQVLTLFNSAVSHFLESADSIPSAEERQLYQSSSVVLGFVRRVLDPSQYPDAAALPLILHSWALDNEAGLNLLQNKPAEAADCCGLFFCASHDVTTFRRRRFGEEGFGPSSKRRKGVVTSCPRKGPTRNPPCPLPVSGDFHFRLNFVQFETSFQARTLFLTLHVQLGRHETAVKEATDGLLGLQHASSLSTSASPRSFLQPKSGKTVVPPMDAPAWTKWKTIGKTMPIADSRKVMVEPHLARPSNIHLDLAAANHNVALVG